MSFIISDPGIEIGLLIAISFLAIGLFGINIGGLLSGAVSTIFGGKKRKTDPKNDYKRMLEQQAARQREFEQRMLLTLEAQKKAAPPFSPMIFVAGFAAVALLILPRLIK